MGHLSVLGSCPKSVRCTLWALEGLVDVPVWQNGRLAFLLQTQALPAHLWHEVNYENRFPIELSFRTSDLLGESSYIYLARNFDFIIL